MNLSQKNLEINFIENQIEYNHISLGVYEHGQDGIFRYWPHTESKKDFYSFLINADPSIVLLSIGQQANSAELFFPEKMSMELIFKLADKYFEEYDCGICLREPLFINWECGCSDNVVGRKIQSKLQEQNIFDNIFINKLNYEELISDLNHYISIFN